MWGFLTGVSGLRTGPEALRGWLWAAIYAGRGAGGPSGPLTAGSGLAHRPSPGKDRLLQGFPDRTETGLWFGLHRFLGHRRSLKPASVEQKPVPGEHLCPPALGLAASQPFCRAVRDLVCLNGNLGSGRTSWLFVLQTPTYSLKLGSLKSQLPRGYTRHMDTQRVCVYEAGVPPKTVLGPGGTVSASAPRPT